MSLLKKKEKELLFVFNDHYRNKTKNNILTSAEYLFGSKGINETSTRDINIHANQRNSSSLSYHFGNKENLIDFILTIRISELEKIRLQKYNDLIESKKNLTKNDLMNLLIGPVIEKISNDRLWKNFLSFYEQVIIFNDSEIITNGYRKIIDTYAKGTKKIYKHLNRIGTGKDLDISVKKRHDFLCFFICSLSHTKKTEPKLIRKKSYIDYLEKISLDILLS
tara:strand:+ start:8913 stop:9578 length:666 start_codon:yes stop_codon:yes gene_type:complete